MPSTPRKPLATAPPVSPEVATRTVTFWSLFFLVKITQALRHKTRAYIFKRKGRAVKQFQTSNALADGNNWEIKIECICNNFVQYLGRNLVSYKGLH